MDCYEGIRKAGEECNNADTRYSKSEDEDEDETSGDEHSNKDVKDGNERICEGPSPRKKRRGKNTKTRTKSQKRQTKKSTKLKGEGYSESPATEEPGCSTSVLSLTPLELDEKLRKSQRGKKAPDTVPGIFPILVKGQQVHYQPWGSQDLEGVISKLPNIHNGASKWIRTFEELTVGKLMAVGDLKALLARVLGLSKMESVLRNGGLDIMDVMHDGTMLDRYRVAMWTTLRREFPTHIDHKNMRGLPINDTENPASYLQAQVDRWRLETDEDPEIHPVFSVMFRNSVIEILPSSIKVKLDDVVGLVTNKSHRDFCDHVVHAVDKYRQNEHKIQEQSKEVQRKLSQLQLEELTKREKEKKKQAVVSESVDTILQAVQQGAPQTQPPQQAFSPPVQQLQSQWSPTPPAINIHTHNNGNPMGQGNGY
ncbi:uncharacterized protein LOC132459063 [Gadus macrocephalus]|uniref:uncharacterized protein LOC132459063 n=1 Tax=Gadus macrocephalus TaxID=80720 RepID=UPI0028CB8153|nr:uncharacterized protein LOC132459063 [Gadus macrocephalus]